VFGIVGLGSGLVPAKSGFCLEVFGEVGLVSGHVRRGRLNVWTCSAIGLSVETCSARSG